MAGIQQNTLYLTTPGSYVARDHLTLQIEVQDTRQTCRRKIGTQRRRLGGAN